MDDTPRTLETKVDAGGILSVRFDGGHWVKLAHGAVTVLSVEDRGGPPRAGSIVYQNTWGLTVQEHFTLVAAKRLG